MPVPCKPLSDKSCIQVCRRRGIECMLLFYPHPQMHVCMARMKFWYRKFLCWKIFVGSKSYKNILTAKSGRMYEENDCYESQEFSKEIVVFEATITFIVKYGKQGLERRWCAEESPKCFRLIRCGQEKRRNFYKPFTWSCCTCALLCYEKTFVQLIFTALRDYEIIMKRKYHGLQ